jgi:hypothetical protein
LGQSYNIRLTLLFSQIVIVLAAFNQAMTELCKSALRLHESG